MVNYTYQKRASAIPTSNPSIGKISREEGRREKFETIVTKTLARAQSSERGFTAGAREVFEEYRQEHEMCTSKPTKEARRDKIETDKRLKKKALEDKGIFDRGSGERKKCHGCGSKRKPT